MSDRQPESARPMQQEYVLRAEVLAGSFERAIQAIADNALEVLEYEIREQTRQCTELTAIGRFAPGTGNSASKLTSLLKPFDEQARVYKKLHLLAKRYEAVLHHSGQTVGMLQALNRGANRHSIHAGQLGHSSIGSLSWLA